MSYLDEYTEQSGERREKILKTVALTLVAVVIVGGVFYYFFKNFFEEQQVREFLTLLQEQNYPAAYELWGCSIDDPCRNYSYEDFLEDWGPASPIGEVDEFSLGRSAEVGSGVIVEIQINGTPQPELWVEKDTKVVGFSPYRFRASPFSS